MVNLNFTPFPNLTTERLTLRQLSIDDKQTIFDLRSDADINKYLYRQPSKTIEDAVSFIEKVNGNFKNNNSVYWAITLTSTKTVVGTICIFDFSDEKNSCEIGYELLTQFQEKGIMKEATHAVIDFVFQTLNFKKILAFTHLENQNSTNLLLKLNFVKSTEIDKENPILNCYILAQ
jgi:[ribosomal protein S5]-alanine N-acetyltransferase